LLVAGVFFRLCGRGGVVFVEGVGGECVCVPGGTPHQGVRTACMRGVCVCSACLRVFLVWCFAFEVVCAHLRMAWHSTNEPLYRGARDGAAAGESLAAPPRASQWAFSGESS